MLLPEVKADDRDDVPPFAWYLHWKLPEPRLSWLKKAKQWRPLVRSYLASTSFMDSQVGRVLDGWRPRGAADKTIIVLWSDNGWHLGEKAITGKNSLWDRSTHVPLIFAGPGSARRRSAPAGGTARPLPDARRIVRTAPGGSGRPQPRPAVERRNAPRPWPAITTANQNNHSVRTEHWRYIRYADGSEELYDHRSDPNEWTNLAKDPQYADVIREHAAWLPEPEAAPAPGSATGS